MGWESTAGFACGQHTGAPMPIDHVEIPNTVCATVPNGLFGRRIDSFDVDALSWLAAGISSSEYALLKMRHSRRCPDNFSLLTHAISLAPTEGLILELGVAAGHTINHIAALRPQQRIYGFDSFEGLPENWRPGFAKGMFAMPHLPAIAPNVELVVGYFDRTLPTFCAAHRETVVAFLHIDCDLYSSTQTVLSQLRDRIKPGTIIVFDEYFNYPGWQQHEFKAFQEFCEANGVRYDYIAIVPSHQQAAVRVLG